MWTLSGPRYVQAAVHSLKERLKGDYRCSTVFATPPTTLAIRP